MHQQYDDQFFLGSTEQIMKTIMIHILLSNVDYEIKKKYDERHDYEKLATWVDCCTILNRRL